MKKQARFCEAHNGISALLVEKSNYDGIWVSSLTQSASKGLPDREVVSFRERANLVNEIKEVTTKPIIVDMDTGGPTNNFGIVCGWFSNAWATIIEDKRGIKQNSLLDEGKHELEDVDIFCEKIKVGKDSLKDTMLFARLESLIAKRSMYDALIRADAYIDSGADGILIHSKQKVDCKEVLDFAKEFKKRHPKKTLIAVPTTYTLPKNHPFDITIDANQMFRASLKGMINHLNGKSDIIDVKHIFEICGH